MGHSSMAVCVLAALVLPGFIYGRPASDNRRSILSMLESYALKPKVFSEQKAISSLIVQENLSSPAKSRQRRLSDQRRAELETLLSLGQFAEKRSLEPMFGNGRLDPMRIGRRRRFTVDQIPTELVSIKEKHIGDPAYPLIS